MSLPRSASSPRTDLRITGAAGGALLCLLTVLLHDAFPAWRLQAAARVDVLRSSAALPGTQAGSAKVSPFEVFPGKGRATGGVRSHRFLKGEDALILAWVGAAPAWACGSAGQPVDLPELDPRRDMSGTALHAPLHAIG